MSATLHMRIAANAWKAFAKPGKRIKTGDRIRFGGGQDSTCLAGQLDATVTAKGEGGEVTLAFDLSGPALDEAIATVGHIPLPPYIASKRPEDAEDRATTRRSTPARKAPWRPPPPACISRPIFSSGWRRAVSSGIS